MKQQRCVLILLSVILCLSAALIPSVGAQSGEPLAEIVYWEDFSQAQATGKINTSGNHRTVNASNGIFVCTTKDKTSYDFSDGTLKYLTKADGDYVDLRFRRGSVMEKDLAQDFVLSFKLKPHTEGFNAQFSFSSTHEKSDSIDVNSKGLALKGGRFYVGGSAADTNATIPANEWSLIEIAFHYNENVRPTNGAMTKGAIDSYTVMLNGESLYTVSLNKYIKNFDFFRMLRWTGSATFELDDLRVALGNQSLKQFDDLGGKKASDYTTNISWFTDKEPVGDYAYSFCIVGDTQIISAEDATEGTQNLSKIYDWIVANTESKKIAHVFGLGDITDNNTAAEWQIARTQIDKLNGVVPYSLVRGNHDGSANINQYFFSNNKAYTDQFEGFFGSGSMENSYRRLSVGNEKYLLITLDWGAKDDVLAWANELVERHANHRVIITTHAYMSHDGDVLSSENDKDLPSKDGSQYNDGDEMWSKLVSKHENIFMVISGHVGIDYPVSLQSEGEKGNKVTQLLVNPQDLDEQVGSSGMVTMLYFSADGKTVEVETYSTVREQFFARENQYVLDVSQPEKKPTYNGELHIGANGNWWIGNTDTGRKATGSDGSDGTDGKNGANGANGAVPYVGENGNWWVGDNDLGVRAVQDQTASGASGCQGSCGGEAIPWLILLAVCCAGLLKRNAVNHRIKPMSVNER